MLLDRYFGLINLGIFILLVLLGFFFLLFPKYNAIVDKRELLNDNKAKELSVKQAYLEKLDQYRAEYEAISQANRTKIENMLLAEEDIEDTFIKMEEWLDGQGLIIESIRLTKTDGKQAVGSRRASTDKVETALSDEIGILKMDISLSGLDYQGVKQLVRSLESDLDILDIESLSFSLNDAGANLSIKTYYLKKAL